MARTFSTAQEDVLTSKKYGVHLRVEVENSTGGFVNLSNLSTADWVQGARWDWSLDQPVAELTVRLRRSHGPTTGQSLSPLHADSTFNYDSTAGFSALVKPGRELNVYTAATTVGGPAPASSAMEWVFQGEIDDVAWPSSPIEVVARSKNMGRLFDRWIMSSSHVYGSSSGVAIETVIEQVLADWTDLSTTVLWTPTSPSFLVAPAYRPEKQSVLDAVTQLTQLIGWNVLEAYSTASSGWRLKFAQPARTVTSSGKVWTFGADQYFDVRDMAMSRRDVRNYVPVLYGPSTGRTKLIVQSTSSQDDYGLRYLEFDESINSPIATSSEAYDLGNSAVTDLKEPPATHEIELPYWWPGELNDFYEFTANGVHYSSNQYLACYGITHELGEGTGRTHVRTRGRPAGHYLQWLNYRSGGNLVFAEVLGTEITFDVDAKAVVSVIGTEGIAKNIYITVGDGTAPADPTAAANHGSLSGQRGVITSTVAVTAGKRAIVKAVAADSAGILGPVITVESARRLAPLVADASTYATQSASAVDLWVVQVSSGTLGTNGVLMCELSATLTEPSTSFPSMPRVGLRVSSSTNLGAANSYPLIDINFGTTAAAQRASGWATLRNKGTSTTQSVQETIDYDPTNSVFAKSVTVVRSTRATLDLADTFYVGIRAFVAATSQAVGVDWTLIGLGDTT